MKLETQEFYTEKEYTRSIGPYVAYRKALEAVFDWSIVENFADLGCSNGRLLETLKGKYPSLNIFGLEYFEWAKVHAEPSIGSIINLGDLGKPYTFEREYDIVNCSEVGEHIDPEYEATFIENLSKATKDILILTWSNDSSDMNGQHVNPRPVSYVKKRLSEKGLVYWGEATSKLRNSLKLNLDGIGHNWWTRNIMVFKRVRFAPIKSRYFIQNANTDNSSHYTDLTSWRCYGQTDLQSDFKSLTSLVRTSVVNNNGLSTLRTGDGDYLFLREIAKGSAKPGRRALTKEYKEINMDLFRSLFWHHDLITLNLEREALKFWRTFIMIELPEKILRKIFKKDSALFRNKYLRYGTDLCLRFLTVGGYLPHLSAWLYSLIRGPLYLKKASALIHGNTISSDAIYSLIITKWIFKNYPDDIGIIAGSEKINLIRNLVKKDEYRAYLKMNQFADYVEVPQKGAADDVENLARSLESQLKSSRAKIFLVGIGSSKIALIPLLQQYSNAVFIDVGAGIDAIAGIICQERPYFSEWVNYRLKDYDYSTIDFMDKENPAWNNDSYRTILI